MTLRFFAAAAALVTAVLIGGCNKPQESKEAIRQALIDYLQTKKASGMGLDPNAMDIQVASVSFAKDEARAVISFRPKNGAGEALEMPYTFENKAGKWMVKGRGPSGGAMGGGAGASPHGGAEGAGQMMPPPAAGGAGGSAMPGGMPPAGGPGGALPPGHPPLREGGAAAQPKNASPPPPAGKQK